MVLKKLLGALSVATLIVTAIPIGAQAEGMHRNMRRQAMMGRMMHHRMYHHDMMRYHHHMMMHHRHHMHY